MLGRARALRRLAGTLQQRRWAGAAALQRNSELAAVSDSDLRVFEDILGPGGVVTDPHELQPYNRCGLLRLVPACCWGRVRRTLAFLQELRG